MDAKWPFILALVIAALIDVIANLMLVKSNGFSRRRYGIISIFLVCLAFSCMAYSVRLLDLSIAYAMWGSFGILGTSIGGWILFKQRLTKSGWLGVSFVIAGVVIMNT